MIRALLYGGPKDGTFLMLPSAMPTFEVARFEPVNWAKALEVGEPFESTVTKGRYELVPVEKDPLHRVARLYKWAGWYE